ncbi:hypothetical protein O6H91_08G037100 [Diphasiastrum complanatum]|uniref:Uncharacterized protein n=5 Tax=Diphasiastrum complanatum TaxID=34168 RepID=A0ACC2CWG1_DIPCM|nr:hypothetical protein O6H91_08G037100 [Diphasiastrum complanatum]KAJ7546359.1 hypothetical protein O6H91_08G037100 [Diphasiastrum complanatum]KAJ7546360.1 hypothetical protein O6H91_08G037100 [Diphasiastrum complanatum]KAJ7546361.1 hypothetical protein O6H91_08G037100 [Diphasiastrum complanatum]KAJ7546362.1 hypothetical protein O6H91_08G037100 [Diphasiastrum complanatum]
MPMAAAVAALPPFLLPPASTFKVCEGGAGSLGYRWGVTCMILSRLPSSCSSAPSLIPCSFQSRKFCGDAEGISSSRLSLAVSRASSLKDSGRDIREVEGRADRDKVAEKETEEPQSHIVESREAEDNADEEAGSRSETQDSQIVGEAKKEHGISGDAAFKGTLVAGLLLVGTVGGFGALGFHYRDQINEFLIQISDFIEGYGPAGYAIFVAVYAGLEVLAIPAVPLTMSAGLLFGTVTGTIIVSISGTIAATLAFLIARYVARERILKFTEGNKKFMAIDKAIGENGFRIVTLLRLSPLLPFSLGNYLYGLTSVKLLPYVLGSWLGMLPGTWAYVSAGAFGRALFDESESKLPGGPEQVWTLGLGLLATVVAATYVTRLAKDAVKDME